VTVSPLHPLVQKLTSIATLSNEEEEAIRTLPLTVKEIRADQDVVRDGDRPTQSCVVVEGFLCRYKQLPDGTRQIHSVHVPGDMPDLQSLHEQPRLADALWRDTLVDAAIFREWIVNVGAREAYARIAHLFCEIFLKLRVVGLTEGYTFQLPITQAELADATGLSTVHVNRSVMQMRANGLIRWEKGQCTIENWQGLKRDAMFDPTYLHLGASAAAA
jgi:CRP-like cAMP-binding protein